MFNADSGEVVQRAGQLIITVLTGTRHKGALEAAAAALSDFCSKLLTNVTHESLPETWLSNILEEMDSSNMAASVTRRSAGNKCFNKFFLVAQKCLRISVYKFVSKNSVLQIY